MTAHAPAGLEATKMSLLSRAPAGASSSASTSQPRSAARIDKAALMSTLRAAAAILPSAASARRVSTDVEESTSLLSSSTELSVRGTFQDQAQTPAPVEAPQAPQQDPSEASPEDAAEGAEAGEQPTALPTLPSMTPWFTRAGLRRRSSTAASMMLPEFDLFSSFEGLPLSLPVQMEEEETEVAAQDAVQPDAEEEVKPVTIEAPAVARPLSQRVIRVEAVTFGGLAVGTLFAVIALSMMT